MKKVLLGMSGGVDSSVAAILLQRQNYEVIGVTMRLWEDETKASSNNKIIDSNAIEDAKKVSKRLGIKHYVYDLREEFRKRVIDNFVCTYMCGKTPNPCVECNKYMKFDAFYKIAKELGCEYIATGHYSKIYYSEKYKQYVLAKANSEQKDQSYFLYGINKDILPNAVFPLAEYNDKEQIRKIAEENGLEVAKKKDSQEVCFIPDNDYISFLKRQNNIDKKQDIKPKGNIVLTNGEILGKHDGIINYTIGQRKGLGISYKEPLYVLQINKDKNEVVVGTEKQLYTKELLAEELNFLLDIELNEDIEIEAKIRYRAKPAKAILKINKNKTARIIFEEPMRAITPGQSVVFYINDVVLGGGKITNKNS